LLQPVFYKSIDESKVICVKPIIPYRTYYFTNIRH
jgi:hypothetical protein